MRLPEVVSRDEWLSARKELLVREKELTRLRDQLNAERRRMPMVRIDKPYRFDGPDGPMTLPEVFDGCQQLIVNHFMFAPDWDEGCPSCAASADEVAEGLLEHLRNRDTALVFVSRAPLEKLLAYQERKGWRFTWYSSFGGDFNYDFHATLDGLVAPVEYNYRTPLEHDIAGSGYSLAGRQPLEQHGCSCFLRVDDTVFHTYSTYARGIEALGGCYYYLDMTALGRQEEWEEPKGRAVEPRAASPDFAR